MGIGFNTSIDELKKELSDDIKNQTITMGGNTFVEESFDEKSFRNWSNAWIWI